MMNCLKLAKQEKEELRTMRKSIKSKARTDPNQFRPSWMQIDKPKRKPGEGMPTTAVPQASLKSSAKKAEKEEGKRLRLRRIRLKAMARLRMQREVEVWCTIEKAYSSYWLSSIN